MKTCTFILAILWKDGVELAQRLFSLVFFGQYSTMTKWTLLFAGLREMMIPHWEVPRVSLQSLSHPAKTGNSFALLLFHSFVSGVSPSKWIRLTIPISYTYWVKVAFIKTLRSSPRRTLFKVKYFDTYSAKMLATLGIISL